ncbi:proteasome inhibitor PI31 subunit-like [Tubulanus polymorphus]|uniref:proteasome inhibitor PI31 subunit-like n=1 Tax=Tubulanus polymorphus TaxID=672921 RepID=UPI003DA57EE0
MMSDELEYGRGLEVLFSAAKNQLKSPIDALILYLHNNLINHGFKCAGTGEEGSWDKKSELLPCGWNDNQDLYVLKYRQTDDNTRHLLKVLVVEGVLLVHLMRLVNEKVACTNVKVGDFTSSQFTEFESAYKDLGVLEKQIQTELLNEVSGRTAAASSQPQRRRDEPRQQHRPEDDDDPLRVGPPRRGGPRNFIPPDHRDPFGVGRGDLDPFGGGAPGMIMDPFRGHPRFGFDPNVGPGGLPRGAVPPGARFDPFGPPGHGGGPPPDNAFRPGPDPDHERPPDFDDMFM